MGCAGSKVMPAPPTAEEPEMTLVPAQTPPAPPTAFAPPPVPTLFEVNDSEQPVAVQCEWPAESAGLLASGTFPEGLPAIRRPTGAVMLSGASDGADTVFGEVAAHSQHRVLHVLGPRNTPSDEAKASQPHTLVNVDDSVLDGPLVDAAFVAAAAARGIGVSDGAALPNGTLEEWRDSRRNYLQVRGAHSVFAVAYRLNPSDTTPALDIGGGTGLACQLYIDRFEPRGSEPASACRLYHYDDGAPGWNGCLKDPATHRKWSMWEAISESWMPLDTPPTLPHADTGSHVLYAGIGGTRLDVDHGAQAIRDLYAAA